MIRNFLQIVLLLTDLQQKSINFTHTNLYHLKWCFCFANSLFFCWYALDLMNFPRRTKKYKKWKITVCGEYIHLLLKINWNSVDCVVDIILNFLESQLDCLCVALYSWVPHKAKQVLLFFMFAQFRIILYSFFMQYIFLFILKLQNIVSIVLC